MAPARAGRPVVRLLVFLAITAGLFGLMAFQNTWTPKLGLDLRGGTTITLTAQNLDPGQGGGIDRNSLEQARTIIQNRVDGLGVGESEITISGDNQIVVAVPNVQRQELIDLVGTTAILTFRLVYAAQPVQPAVPPPSGSPSAGETPAPSGSPGATPAPSGSAGATPAASPTGNGRPMPQLPTLPPATPGTAGADVPLDQSLAWQPTQEIYQQFLAYTCDQPIEERTRQPLVTCNEDGTEKYLLGPSLIEGRELTSASAGIPQNRVEWVVNLSFNAEGTAMFEQATGQISQQQDPMNRFAIVLDGKSVSAPSVSSAIPGGNAEISGSFNQQSAESLANILKYGSLPLAFEVSSVDTVSATLGSEQLEAGIIAGLIGMALVLAYALFYYRGLFIVIFASLGIGAALTYAFMVLLGESVGFALNLPGIAGAIVAIGVTADSFIIYFERIRDEVRDGRTLRTAVESGWTRAFRTIIIADAVSLLSAVILFVLAIGSVKGFAFTLGLTTVIDLAVVVLFTKPLMSVLAKTKFFGGGHRLSGLDARHLGVTSLPGRRGRLAGGRA